MTENDIVYISEQSVRLKCHSVATINEYFDNLGELTEL